MSRRNPKLKYMNKPNQERQFINTVFGVQNEDYSTNEPIETTTSVFYGKKVGIHPRNDSLFTNRTLRPFSQRNNMQNDSYHSGKVPISAPETARASTINEDL